MLPCGAACTVSVRVREGADGRACAWVMSRLSSSESEKRRKLGEDGDSDGKGEDVRTLIDGGPGACGDTGSLTTYDTEQIAYNDRPGC